MIGIINCIFFGHSEIGWKINNKMLEGKCYSSVLCLILGHLWNKIHGHEFTFQAD